MRTAKLGDRIVASVSIGGNGLAKAHSVVPATSWEQVHALMWANAHEGTYAWAKVYVGVDGNFSNLHMFLQPIPASIMPTIDAIYDSPDTRFRPLPQRKLIRRLRKIKTSFYLARMIKAYKGESANGLDSHGYYHFLRRVYKFRAINAFARAFKKPELFRGAN